jgi:hypothetical protein
VETRFARGSGWMIALSLACCSCSTLHVPASRPRLEKAIPLQASVENLQLVARPVEADETYRELFEESLPEIGILAVWLEARNRGPDTFDFRKASWEIRSSRPVKLRRADNKTVLGRYYKARGIRAYTLHTHEKALSALECLSFPDPLLKPNQSAEGFIFFISDERPLQAWTHGARIIVRQLRQAGRRLTVEIPSHEVRP